MLKKAFAILVIFGICSIFAMGASAASEEFYIFSSIYSSDKWTYDEDAGEKLEDIQDKEFKNPASYPNYKYSRTDMLAKTATQGENGFYYMYSTDFNKGGSFDTTTFKECVWSAQTSYAAWGFGKWKFWCPAVDAPEPFVINGSVENFWWEITDEGYILPHGNMTAALKWVVPADGRYKVEVNAQCGYIVPDPTWIEDILSKSDGDILMVYKNTEKLSSKEAPKGTETVDLIYNKTLEDLKQGDAFYFIGDQKGTPYYDKSQWKVKITRYIDDATPVPTESVSESPTPEPAIEATPTNEPTPAATESPTAAPASSVPPSDSGTPWGMIIGLVVIALAAIGGVLYYIFSIRKKANPVG